MGTTTKWIGGASIVLAPLLAGVADQLRMAAEPPAGVGMVDTEYGVESVVANLESIGDHQALFVTGASFTYAAALLTIPALVAIWRLSVDGSRRWAWAGAVLATLGVTGQVVHVAGYHGVLLAALRHEDRQAAAQFVLDVESTPFMLVVFLPFFFALLCVVPQAVGLRRAGVVPLWACLAMVTATVFFLFAGSTPWTSAVWTVLLVAGMAPAARAMLRGDGTPARQTLAEGGAPALA